MLRSKLAFNTNWLMFLVFLGCQPTGEYQKPPPPKVTVLKPTVETVPVYLEENGQTEAVEQAVVQARVRGILQEIKFEPNNRVTEGTPLFVIEQQEYLTAVKSAEAALNSAKAEVTSAIANERVVNAKIAAAQAAINEALAEFNRMKSLETSKAVSQSEIDSAKAKLETSTAAKLGAEAEKDTAEAAIENAQARVEQAEADLAQAKLNLEWTVVKAPIDGRMTRTMVKRGNLVESGTELVEIVKNDPIWANFNINERFLLNLERQSRSVAGVPPDPTTMKVFLQRAGDEGFPFEGHLDYYAPKVDQDTGTMQLRAVFKNELGDDNFLLPGLFVRVRVQVGEYENAMLIPERAINRDQVGAFVYVVDDQNKAIRKNVTVGSKYNDLIVIESGISAEDAVIVDGIQRVRPGAKVDPG